MCVDPYLSNTVEAAEGMKRLIPIPVEPEQLEADYMIFTHDHLDHFDEVSVRRLAKKPITFMGPGSCMERLKQCGIRRGIQLERGEHVRIAGQIRVRAVYACHTDDSIGLVFQKQGEPEGGLYLTGDTEYVDKLTEVKRLKPELLITCINGKLGNMGYESAAHLARELGVSTAIPCHYGMFADNTEDPKKFEDALEGSGIRYLELEVMNRVAIK